MPQGQVHFARDALEALQLGAGAGRPAREAILFTLRDLVVLIVLVAVVLWLADQIARK